MRRFLGGFVLLFLLQLKNSICDSQESIRQGRFFFGDLDLFFKQTDNSINGGGKGTTKYKYNAPAPPRDNFVGSTRIDTYRDALGEFFYGSTGNQVYIRCFEKYRVPSEGCRGRPIYFPSNPAPPVNVYQPSYEDTDDADYVEVSADEARRYRPYYGRFDGRGNVNVGRGVYSARGRDMEINCNFPRARDVKQIVWCRVPSYNSRSNWNGEPQEDRLRVQRLGRTSTKLIIRNFQRERDSGTYRCFGLRNRDQRLEPVFMETVVSPPPNYYSSDRNKK